MSRVIPKIPAQRRRRDFGEVLKSPAIMASATKACGEGLRQNFRNITGFAKSALSRAPPGKRIPVMNFS